MKGESSRTTFALLPYLPKADPLSASLVHQCLYPIEVPKEKLFQPYEPAVASTSSLPQLLNQPSPADSSALAVVEPFNAVASSSRQPVSFPIFHPSPDLLLQTFLYKSPTS